MLRPQDLNKWEETYPVSISTQGTNASSSAQVTILGTLTVVCDVQACSNLRNLTTVEAYLITCTTRLTLTSPASVVPAGDSGLFVLNAAQGPYNDYLGAFTHSVIFGPVPQPFASGDSPTPSKHCALLDYFPRTINAGLTSSSDTGGSQSDGHTASTSYTAGSSNAQTNSFDISVSEGLEAGPQGFGASVSSTQTWGRSATREQDRSRTAGGDTNVGRSTEAGQSIMMSIKDWGSFALVDPNNQVPTWLWGQQYPWNVLQVNGGNFTSGGTTPNTFALPSSLTAQLYDQTSGALLPPSQLSVCGVNFVTKATWIVPAEVAADDENIAFIHTLTGFLAGHQWNKTGPYVEGILSPEFQATFQSPNPIPLRTLALAPVLTEGSGNGALIGFAPGQFIYPPQGGAFRIKSFANNLYVTGSGGFSTSGPDQLLTATGFTAKAPATLTVYFKLLDKDLDWALYLKHWKTHQAGCVLTLTVNGGPSITRHVDSYEASSGDENLTTVLLCNRDYTSVDFYDYLSVGLNMIVIDVTPSTDTQVGPSGDYGYALRALAIG